MKIVKYLNHLGVDSMLKTALGDDLTVFRFNDSTGWITRDQMDFDYVDGDIANGSWDIFIFDDIITVRDYLAQPVRARHHVWYCHGTYTPWEQAQKVFNLHFQNLNMAVIFTDSYKQTMVDQWRDFPVRDVLVLPLALGQHRYKPIQDKNGRIFTVGNDYNRVCSIYPRYRSFAQPAIETLIARYAECLDVFGHNGSADGEIFGNFRRGSADISTLTPWSASIHLSGVASIGFVLAECFAAAIPVLSTPKYQLPNDGTWIPIQTVDQMISAVDDLLSHPARAQELGLAGQDMFKKNFGIDQYGQQMRAWLENLL
jgi:hypothetical protein